MSITTTRPAPAGAPANTPHRVGWTALTAIAPMVWGTTYIVTTHLLPEGHPLFAAMMRSLPAGLIALLIARRLPRGSWWWKSLVLGTLNMGAFFPLLFVAAQELPGGVAATLGAAQPIVIAFLAVAILHETLSLWRLCWGVLGMVGVALVVLGPEAAMSPVGVLAGLAGAASMGTGVVLTKKWGRPDGVSAIGLAGWQLTAAGLVLLFPALLVDGVPPDVDGAAVLGYAWLGLIGAAFTLTAGIAYLEWRRKRAAAAGETYGTDLRNEPATPPGERDHHPLVALLPLVVVGVANYLLTRWIPGWYPAGSEVALPGLPQPMPVNAEDQVALWAVMGALIAGIVTILLFSFRAIKAHFAEGSKSAVSGALLASMNTAAEYGFGGVIAALPGFLLVADALKAIPDPLVGEAVAVTSLAGITGSASGGMSIALAAMAQTFIDSANAAGIPMEVLHRIAAMASGGMDTLPHNGAVITLLAVTGLTHRQSYGDIFAITVISTLSVFLAIAVYYLTGIV
jgi:drug/metabolite transporter (DMT)-like permease